MSKIFNKLDQLEARLQMLIEGHITRLIPAQISKNDLIKKIIEAMQVGTQKQGDGTLLAPDVFHIQVHPQNAPSSQQQELLIQEMGDLLQQAVEKSDFHFAKFPTINLTFSNDISPGEIEILAAISQEPLGKTHALEVESNEDVENIPPNAFLIVNGTQIFSLEKTVVNIGRRGDNDLVLDHPQVSRQHAQLRATRGRYLIFDLESTGGTFVNDRRISQSSLHPKDVISIAGIPLVYAQDESTLPEDTQEYNHQTSSDSDQATQGRVL